jgi:hypothetical protein
MPDSRATTETGVAVAVAPTAAADGIARISHTDWRSAPHDAIWNPVYRRVRTS